MMLFASECHFAWAVLQTLLKLDMNPSAVILPGHRSLTAPLAVHPPAIALAMANNQESVTSTAQSAGIPVFRIGKPTPETIEQLPGTEKRPILLSVCYPRLIPVATVELFADHSLNIHPSLLPDLRGPDPMFWTFHRGTRIAGVTLHKLSPEYDAGPIVAQQQVDWVEGESESALESRLATVAGNLLSTFLEAPYPGVEQEHVNATWAPMPAEADFRVGPDWSNQRTFDFVQGIGERGFPIHSESDEES